MKKISNNIIALLMILLMAFSICNTIFVTRYADKKGSLTGKATLEGTVSILVNESSLETPGTPGSTSGGNGGNNLRTPVIHILNFIEKDIYLIQPFKDDSYITIFINSNYTFLNKGFTNGIPFLSIQNIDFLVPQNKLIKIAFNNGTKYDLSIRYDGVDIIFSAIRQPEISSELPPIISTEDIILEPGLQFPIKITNNLFWLLIIILFLLLILGILYQQTYIKGLRSNEEIESLRIYKNYKNHHLKLNVFDTSKSDTIQKLIQQREHLEQTHKLKNISDLTYEKGKKTINNLINKL